MKKSNIILIVVLALVFLGLISSVYTVREDKVAVISTFGEIKAVIIDTEDKERVKKNLAASGREKIEIVDNKGLHFKIPFIQKVDYYTAKYLTFKSREEIINTKDDKRIEIQMYAQYRVVDPIRFKLSVGTKAEANKRMDEIVYKIVIQSVNSLEFDEFFDENTLEDLLDSKHSDLNDELLQSYGIYVTDIGINRKKFPDSNVASVESKMTLQIEKDSEKLIAEGDSEYVQAQASANREKAEIVATAVEEAAIIKAEADATAISIIQDSLQKDLPFYQFLKRMEIYAEMKDTTIFVDGNNEIFDLLNGYVVEPAQ